jgi:hypothetical protein
MEIACAGCGCVVDRGVIIERCESHPSCCCGELLVLRRGKTTVALRSRDDVELWRDHLG